VAWQHLPVKCEVKLQCQELMHGMPELRMIGCICQSDELKQELVHALALYAEGGIANFVDLVRTLDRKAHNRPACIPNCHH
jgi:hypothetical protein